MLARLVVACAVVALLAGCGGSKGTTLARVGDQRITAEQVDTFGRDIVDNLRREGEATPAVDSRGRKVLEQRALGILTSRAQLEQKADQLGLKLSADEVDARIAKATPPGGEQDTNARLIESQTRAQLLYEKLFDYVTAKVPVSDAEEWGYYDDNRALYGSSTFAQVRDGIHAQLLARSKNRRMDQLLAQVRREFPVRKP